MKAKHVRALAEANLIVLRYIATWLEAQAMSAARYGK